VDRLFKRADTNRDGKITKSELTQALESDSVNLGTGEDQKAKVDAIFNLLDPGGKGYITKQDATDGLEKLAQMQADRSAAATPPARHGGGGGDGGGGGTTVTAVDMDPADTNQDGKVSMQEEMTYALKQYQQQVDWSAQQAQSPTYA
jgi:Ca2+-binding EF-hand superfamily protein